MKEKSQEVSEFEQSRMKAVLKAIKAGEIHALIKKVSSSGMSRNIAFYMTYDKKYIEDVTVYVAWLRGAVKIGEYKQGKNYLNEAGLRVGGCGMDMIFYTLYNCMPYEEAKNWNQNYRRL